MNIYSICNKITELFTDKLRNPAKKISGIIMLCSLMKRPGLSCVVSTGRIIEDISKKGLVTEDIDGGCDNKMNILVHSISCEIIRALKEDMNIQCAMEPASLTFTANGANAGGPIVLQGNNINFGKGVGLMQ